MAFILPFIFLLLFLLVIYKFNFFKTSGINTHYIAGIFIIKLLAGISVFVIYTYYYSPDTADLYKYYNGGLTLFNKTENSFVDYLRLVTGIQSNLPHLHEVTMHIEHWSRKYDYGLYIDNRTIIRFHAGLCLISHGNIYVHIIIMAFLSFLGSIALFKASLSLLSINKYLILIITTLTPSLLFWSSGLLKEGLVIFSMGFMLYYLVKSINRPKISSIILTIVFSYMLFLSKVYMLPVIIPAAIFLILTKNTKKRYQFAYFLSILIITASTILFSKNIIGYDIPKTIAGKQNDFINFITQVDDGSGSNINLKRIEPNMKSIVKRTPNAVFNSFFRPLPKDIKSFFTFFAFIENLFIPILIILAFVFFKPINKEKLRFLLFSIMFTFLLYSLIGLSTPNIGAIVRYKIPALPFIYLSIFCFIDTQRLKEKVYKYTGIKKVFTNLS